MDGSAAARTSAKSATPNPHRETHKRDAVERELLTLWGHINAATYRFIALVAEFDRNEYWSGAGILSCAHWLNVYCGIDRVTAREKVRVARALETLPLISRAFERGEISYSKARAMARTATPETESTLLEIARYGTASQLERLVGHCRSVERREETRQAEQQQLERYLRAHYDEHGALVLNARLPGECGAIVMRAIEAVVKLESRSQARASAESREGDSEQARSADRPSDSAAIGASAESSRVPVTEEQPFDRAGARRADALKRLAEHFLAAESKACPSSAERYQVVVHVDQALLAGTDDTPLSLCELEDGPRLACETARRLACDGHLIGLVESGSGDPLDVGRKTRAIPRAIKRALLARDRHCRFPGCERHRYTEGHHIEHWARGGQTKLENLVLLCAEHHRLLHEGGFGITLDADGEPEFLWPDGRPLLDDRAGHDGRAGHNGRRCGRRQSPDAVDPPRFRGSAQRASDDAERAELELIALNTTCGLDIDAETARTRWSGETLDYSLAVEWLHSKKHGTSLA